MKPIDQILSILNHSQDSFYKIQVCQLYIEQRMKFQISIILTSLQLLVKQTFLDQALVRIILKENQN